MAKATKGKAPRRFGILQPTQQDITGLVYAKVGSFISLRHFYVSENDTNVFEEVAYFWFDDLIDLIWRGKSPYSWFKNQADFINPDCKLNVEADLFVRIEEEVRVYGKMVSCKNES